MSNSARDAAQANQTTVHISEPWLEEDIHRPVTIVRQEPGFVLVALAVPIVFQEKTFAHLLIAQAPVLPGDERNYIGLTVQPEETLAAAQQTWRGGLAGRCTLA